jgi:asparagine synthase (glutamine-hydrolysing)
MCGITGVIRFDAQPVDQMLLRRQTALLMHRGPDDEGTWAGGSVGLGFRRLAIIDLSPGGRQPMVTVDGSHVIIYNGELYNTPELRSALGARTYRGHSDTEVLLYAVAEKGIAALAKLEGIFAFALYDIGAEELWLVRDPFGVKPLYYHRNARRLCFASEITPLLLDPETPRRPNWAAIRQHVLLGYALDPGTAFEGIERVPPGCALRVRPDGSVSLTAYWALEQLLEGPPVDVGEALAESASRQAIADVPMGIFLSGGLDSSLLLANLAARNAIPSGFRAYNVGLDPQDRVVSSAGRAERHLAALTCARYGVPLVRIHPLDPEAPSIAEMVESVEEPICNPSNSLIDLICRRAREDGTTVLLSGHGGDEVFGGYRRHVWARHLPTLRRAGAGLAAPLVGWLSRDTLVRRMAASLRPPRGIDPLVTLAAMGWDLPQAGVLTANWFPRTAVEEVVAPLQALLARWKDHSPLKQMMLLDLQTYLSAQNLINMDKVSMRRSVEVRVPFLYRPLVAAGLRLPDAALVEGRRNKAVIRHLAAAMLPAEVVAGPKLGFGPPQVQLVAGEEYRELLLGRRTRERGLVNPAAVEGLASRLTPSSENLAVQLYGLAIIEQWFRSFMDQSPVTH